MFDGKRQPAVYILASPNRRAIYVGVTTNLERRLIEHRLGRVEHTAQYNIRCLVYVEAHETAPDAIAREKQIKRWRREKKVALIDSVNPEWEDLAPEASM
ncbi:GIY-YIG nuclease family protein [Vineibacter terrae]|uniref:GIY-YIG nuclease family protein n=2 Tax=Vineibacter terrae TaxID=2586908 RepID=A0A5C8PIZ5_9HYPH|nr:GIY-YIG nuclease family protein [Vineibacter terrae]TXL73357.1 GIY-YIG nuclease family protein [Vineibacter terrae]